MPKTSETVPVASDPDRPPAISVLMPVHNGEAFLPAALDSLLAQDMADFELVIVDDCSGPGASAILADYAARDSRIRLLRNQEQQGVARTLNRGLAECRAPYTARADADDLYLPQRLTRQLAFLQANPDIAVVSCGYREMREDGELLGTTRPPTDPAIISFERLFLNRLLHPGVMFRTAPVREMGGYDPEYWTAQDSELWARLARTARLANIAEPLVHYRVHAKSVMRSRGEAGRTMSYSVPEREIRDYLRGDPGQDALRAAIELYRGFAWISPADARLGERVLRQVRAVAARQEPVHVVRHFRRTVGRNLVRLARRHWGISRVGAALLAARGVWWGLRPSASAERTSECAELRHA